MGSGESKSSSNKKNVSNKTPTSSSSNLQKNIDDGQAEASSNSSNKIIKNIDQAQTAIVVSSSISDIVVQNNNKNNNSIQAVEASSSSSKEINEEYSSISKESTEAEAEAEAFNIELADLVLSWSLEDILDHHHFLTKVEMIPKSFESVDHYLRSFAYPLLEEIRGKLSSKMDIISEAPYALVISIKQSTALQKALYDVNISPHGKEPLKALPGDFVILTDSELEDVSDLQRWGRVWSFGYISDISGDEDGVCTSFRMKTSKELDVKDLDIKDGLQGQFFLIFLMNLTTEGRIWDALHLFWNHVLIQEVLSANSVVNLNCNLFPWDGSAVWAEKLGLSSYLNECQYKAVVSCICSIQHSHKPTVDLIWGPPGTGKTRTLRMLLWSLLKLNCRTLACSGTDVAIAEVASHVVKQIRESCENRNRCDASFCCLGDVLLFGKKDQFRIDIDEIYLEYRIEKLVECFGPVKGWKYCLTSMMEFFEDFRRNGPHCDKECNEIEVNLKEFLSFLPYATDRFRCVVPSVRRCLSIMCTQLPKKFIHMKNFKRMESLVSLLNSFEALLLQDNMVSEDLKGFWSIENVAKENDAPSHVPLDLSTLLVVGNECLSVLKALWHSLNKLNFPCSTNRDSIEKFCFRMASLIFCTASNSYKLHSLEMEPMQLFVMDEAAQLRECESAIPLQLPGIRHAVLIGDECQLTATINSKVSEEAGLGRSLFERLSVLGYSRHLLKIQYRMNPHIALFPNSKFYGNMIMDAPSVKRKSYKKRFLPHMMFGAYSFINIPGRKVPHVENGAANMVEVAVILKILHLLHKACDSSKQSISIGVLSPYFAQVAAIQQKLGKRYENSSSFSVKVSTVDGFQGREEDVIIISTAGSNIGSSIGCSFAPNCINVALTRARHCLWVLGNETALSESGTIWDEVIHDAKVRKCFFHADEDKELAKVIFEVKKELDELGDLLCAESALFRNARWKVLFSENFKKSFSKIKSVETKRLTLFLLSKLSNGWRPKRNNICAICESPFNILSEFKVGELYIICSVDIVKDSWYIQALKVWDILPFQEIPKLVNRLNGIIGMYTDNYLFLCQENCFESGMKVPKSWPPTADIIQYKSLRSSTEVGQGVDIERPVEKSKVRDSLLLMKFYSLSSGVVNNLLHDFDGGDLGIPFELTSQEKEIVLFDRSSFVLGRSGTGKTTVLTMKLFQNEQDYHQASEGFYEVEKNASSSAECSDEATNDKGSKQDRLHQIFVTVSPKLCYAVKQHVSQLERFICGWRSDKSSPVHMDDIDDTTLFSDLPQSFINLPPDKYPLIITFHKFLLMLDGTVGTSYFERFPDVRRSGTVALETFIRTKEVTYDRFSSTYWPRLNTTLTRNFDCSSVFTQIMSVIKGGLRTEVHNGKLCQQDYISLSEDRTSTLHMHKRELIYSIFLEYEKKKLINGDFDLADLVMDLHRRFKDEMYPGDEIDFVYIDEVQDLSMRQISLFKYICKNVTEGYTFCGDTAQTIAKGINFRFEDIRCLFFQEFVVASKRDATLTSNEKGHISRILQLSQNFRTHDGVLKLAQSVIDLIYHFFPFSIDVLKPESSLLSGEAPVLLKTLNDENPLKTIFGKSGDARGHIVGFGAEQVILVRDEYLRKEIGDVVGKRALVLTIMECKGLEFQDVLLYDFFSSSPFKNQWRIIYEYMKEKELLASTTPLCCTSFDQEKHAVLCAELKQLYVAITRTKQRLWICESMEELPEPVFEYWKKLCLVKERKLDESFAYEMQVASSPEEWRSRGIELFFEHSYDTAKTCFAKAGDTYWERLANASGLRAAADCMNSLTIKKSSILMEAAELFYSIGKAESAAQCFFEIREYKRAGDIYLKDFAECKLEKAGECYSQAKCFELAAEVYDRARNYPKCLSSCLDGNLFKLGFQYIKYWKENDSLCATDSTVQKFLESGALHYFKLKDKTSMMKFVESLHSKDSIRIFLKKRECIEELLSLEIEWRNFLEAANLAKEKNDHLLEADLLEKAGLSREASIVILWYVFSSSLQPQSKLDHSQKQELLTRAKLIASSQPKQFHEIVCVEAEMLSKGGTSGEVLEKCLEFVCHYMENAAVGLERVKTRDELEKIEQNMLERCALHFHDLNDKPKMMTYTAKFQSIDLVRSFYNNLSCLDELQLLEETQGNFLRAANIADKRGTHPNTHDRFKDASIRMLWYALTGSLWKFGSRGWPLMEFKDKEKLLERAIACAKNHSDPFYKFVCTEAYIISSAPASLSQMGEYLSASEESSSLRGQVLSSWRILDAHIKYDWSKLSVNNLVMDSGDAITVNRFSVEGFVKFWTYWRDMILKLIDHLGSFIPQGGSGSVKYEAFCLNFFGVRKQNLNKDARYILLNSGARWVKKIDSKLLQRSLYVVSIGSRDFFSTAQSYWCSELLSVGIEVLKKIELLHSCSANVNISVLQRSMILVHMFEIAKYLENCMLPYDMYSSTATLRQYLKLSVEQLLRNSFHMDWKKSSSKDMIAFRETDVFMKVLEEAIDQNVISDRSLTYGQMGRLAMMILGSGKHTFKFFDIILRSSNWSSSWGELIYRLSLSTKPESTHVSSANDFDHPSNDELLVPIFYGVLKETYSVDWRSEYDYLSPACFLYLAERLLILVSRIRGYCFTTRSSCVEWLIYEEWSVNSSSSSVCNAELSSSIDSIHEFLVSVVHDLLHSKDDLKEWIRKSSDHEGDNALVLLRLVLLLCLVCLNSGGYFNILFDLLDFSAISSQLPHAFVGALQRTERYFVHAVAEAFEKINNPLVMVSLTQNFSVYSRPGVIFLNMNAAELCKEALTESLFVEKLKNATSSSSAFGL